MTKQIFCQSCGMPIDDSTFGKDKDEHSDARCRLSFTVSRLGNASFLP